MNTKKVCFCFYLSILIYNQIYPALTGSNIPASRHEKTKEV